MSASPVPPRRPSGPDAGLDIVVTPDGQAWVDGHPVPVPAGTDPRVAAAEFVSGLAKRCGQDISAMLADTGRDERRRMIFKADGQILQSVRPLPASSSAQQASQHTDWPAAITGHVVMRAEETRAGTGEAEPRTAEASPRASQAPPWPQDAERRAPDDPARPSYATDEAARFAGGPGAEAHPDDRARASPEHAPGHDDGADLMMTPGPPLDVDPDSVPAWPHFDITLLSEVHVVVNGVRHVIPRAAADPRAYAVGVAAAQLRRMGLARPVRATARDPDGTIWPILIHPGGAATEAGPPETPGEKARRGRRRADRGAFR